MPFVKGDPRINLKGRPKGTKDFSTRFREAVEAVAEQQNKTPEQVELEIYTSGLLKAKSGEYNYYRDTLDRIHGKPQEKLDVTTLGEKINITSFRDEHSNKRVSEESEIVSEGIPDESFEI